MSAYTRIFLIKYSVGIGILASTLLLSLSVVFGEEQTLFDFEKAGLGDDWTAVGKIAVARKQIPDVAGEEKPGGPSGHGAVISVARAGGFFTKPGRVSADWRSNREVRFWLYRSPAEAEGNKASTMELQMLEPDGKARFWRKMELTHHGWRQFTIPLREMRWGPGRVPQYDRIGQIGFWFRDPAEVTVDQVIVDKTDSPTAAMFSTDDLRTVAFPQTPASEIFSAERPSIRLLTNESELDVERLAEHLEAVARKIQQDLRFEKPPNGPATLIVFSTDKQYQEFPTRFAKLLNSAVEPPRSQGFTLHGISTSSWDPKIGTLRPVYTHEFVHSYLAHSILIQNQGGWFQEGLASYYQIQIHPQDDFPQIVAKGIADPQLHLPLDELCNGRQIPTNRYWQALTFMEMLLFHPDYKTDFPRLIAAFQKNGSTNLETVREAVLGREWSELYEDWRSFCAAKYGAAK